MFSPGVLAANSVSSVSPLLRAEQLVQVEMARNIVSTARAPAFPLVDRLSLFKTRPSNFNLSLLPDSVRALEFKETKCSDHVPNVSSMMDLVTATAQGWHPPPHASKRLLSFYAKAIKLAANGPAHFHGEEVFYLLEEICFLVPCLWP